MNDSTNSILVHSAERLFADVAKSDTAPKLTINGEVSPDLWKSVDEMGFCDLLRNADNGGAEATPEQLFQIAQLAGRYALPMPLVQTIIGRAVLDQCGLPAPEGALSVAFAGFPQSPAGESPEGRYIDVPWARPDEPVVLVSLDDNGATVEIIEFAGQSFKNIAGEPEGRLILPSNRSEPTARLSPETAGRFWLLTSLAQASLISGALEKVLEMSVQYVSDRVIFGKHMKTFQVVQHQTAQMAEEVCAGTIITHAAARSFDEPMGDVMVAAARARLADAVEFVASAAHQFHGAMGFTLEFPLQQSTKRLWAWRDQYGTAVEWRKKVGRTFIGLGSDELWPKLSGTAKN
ncbi:acyl-CoA dehydrogenase family protein [Chelativorans sp. AA-79]|uniref:acyl-CoA dehydrogenase family protein n=1 Tax=Chelativorans sp. AA-79 TaxID=3028735 RepID=UPI0023F76C27|nr:acyl-CoA dehydrogenase family protein [Chelativorans sp. AA-79]WEX12448.1 acyl-CoA dehydrogenase family protein [Chelativorans sp. AA-79]